MSTNSRGPSALKGMQRSLSQRVSCSDIGRGAGVGILLITIACGGGATLSETRGPDAPVSSAVHPLSPTVESSPVPVVTAAAARNDWMTLGARAAVASSGAAPPASVNERAERELLGAERPASPPAPVGERSETPRSEEPVAHSPEHVGLEPAAEMVIPEEYLVQPGDTLSQIAECFGVRVTELRSANQFSLRRQARAGEVLHIPGSATHACTNPERAPPANCAPVTRGEAAELASRCLHRVKVGESASLLAARVGLTVEQLLAMNRCTTDQMQLGQVMRLCRDSKRSVTVASQQADSTSSKSTKVEPPLTLPRTSACEPRIRTANEADGSRRVLVLSNGAADRLFGMYVDEVKRRHLDTDWTKLVIMFVNESGAQISLTAEKLTFGETVLGLSDVRKWKKRLKGMKAAARSNAIGDAEALGGDLMCLPSAP